MWTADTYLAHHGILGQRWGHKQGPPYPLGSGDHSAAEKKAGWRKSLEAGGDSKNYSRKIRKSLNKLDQQQADLKAKIATQEDKLAQKKKKNPDADVSELTSEIKFNKEFLEWSKGETIKLIDSAIDAGYTIESKEMLRQVNVGRNLAISMLTPVVVNQFSEGTYYKATKDMDPDKIRQKSNRAKTDEEHDLLERAWDKSIARKMSKQHPEKSDKYEQRYQEEKKITKENKIEKAKHDDVYDIGFLEAVQNSDLYNNRSNKNYSKDMQKEYSKYLDDPQKYWTEERHKLKDWNGPLNDEEKEILKKSRSR